MQKVHLKNTCKVQSIQLDNHKTKWRGNPNLTISANGKKGNISCIKDLGNHAQLSTSPNILLLQLLL